MSGKKKILLQLDTDSRPSAFDSVVAVDSGVDVLLPYADISPDNVRALIYGAIFTRGVKDLASTAVFVGGSDVGLGENVLAAARDSFLGPLQVSLMLDSGGANTTAAAAVIAALRQLGDDTAELAGRKALVLGATGPVGRRVVRLLAAAGADVVAGSRSLERATAVVEETGAAVETTITAAATADPADLIAALDGVELVVAAGGPGVCLLPAAVRREVSGLKVAIDLNAVPPEGIEGIKPTDADKERDGQTVYGAIGVGGIKMKIHKACVARLFTSNDHVLDAESVLDVGRALEDRQSG